ncbi:MAG: methionyl-tRNA formyltransferase [Candidatus Scalindua sp. AMX11]|nr:MAG: methionyl-tRNA formyltransferase [Candidatus Scalindua sp.]NOG85623.1 methionyl-tRNA formyltransferase [Planctomycetota bacterium]RZV82479.1 MAG: methionyl-tRNA formyltransferase [Candidatus Scalindua sp. SCAELEC01]TDE65595.1 MAG: methionyl-tRNA formyltransferase [Candidatus Scalindua sp. AMX11]GJQ59210.1 MAG: methionyl-tRNA formyltransferase [Candidatus Scalindua sp.]
MNVIFMGTPGFAVPSLESLVKSRHKIVTVVTQTDKPIGRKRQPCPPPIKEAALGFGIPIIQPKNINDEVVVGKIAGLSPDLIVTVAFGQKISSEILDLPRYICLNIHASLLPKYRGAAPINWALIRGDEETGITSMVMREKMDAGEIIMQKSLRVGDNETAGELGDRLSSLGAEVLMESIDQLDAGDIKYTKQDESLVTYAPKLKKRDGLINWNQNTKEIHNFVRGVNPWPGAYTTVTHNNKTERIIILETEYDLPLSTRPTTLPGTVSGVSDRGIKVVTKNGFVWIARVKPEGKREMKAAAFLHGHGINTGDLFK